jgi:hypothetical protein
MRIALSKIFFLATIVALVSSCKRDVIYGDLVPNTERPIVEFAEPSGFITVAMDYTDNTIEVDVTDIRYMIRSEPTVGATAKIIINPTVVNEYNTNNGTNYSVVPVTNFSLVSDQFSLSPTERSQRIKIRIKPSDVAIGENAIGISISEANGAEPSRIAGTLVVALLVKNQYDGRYRLDGAFYHPTSSPAYSPFTIDVELHTSGLNSVKMYVPDFGGYFHPGLFDGVLNAFGAQEPEYTINSTTNAVTVQNAYPGAVTFYNMAPGFNSRYDPVEKVIYAKFGYNYSAGPVFNPATNREWTDKLTYLGPR